ncbi:hypothetical protein Vadar_001425 [Vaccinium darrowii]|uniref:Uncharacterized protein n=1 Tax=Vaccinium darrowii TaxID=229202 RepID=A0ACB7WWT9_9ERIC|nr:hypothetical protein Vadar_001425 [Vaccinium darrowii]
MKTLIILLITTGSALLCLQADGRRFMISEETNKDEANNQLIHDTQMKLDEVKNGATEINRGKSSTFGKNRISGSVPKVDEKGTINDANKEKNSSDDEKNDSYGSHGNPARKSTDSSLISTSVGSSISSGARPSDLRAMAGPDPPHHH